MSKYGRNLKCPSTDEWIKRIWYVCTMEYDSDIKRNEILPFASIWMDLDGNIARRKQGPVGSSIFFVWLGIPVEFQRKELEIPPP